MLDALKGRIFYNPLVTGYEIKDRFIAGNVIEKAERIEAWMGDNPENGRMPEVKQALLALKEAEPPRIAFEDLSAEYPEHKFLAVDSLCASMGEGLLVYHAAQQQKAGRSIEETARWLEENKLHLAHWFTVDDLNHLKRGGRVSGAAAFFGTMLNIKPVLHVDDAGHLIPMEKVRGRKASLDALVAHMEKDAVDPASQTVFISHGDCRADAEYVADLVREKFGTQDIRIHSIGPVIGSHSGPGTVALFYLGRTRG